VKNTDEKIRAELNKLPILELVNVQREKGRHYLANSQEPDAAHFRQFWNKQHHLATKLLEDEGRGRKVRQLATLLKEITFSVHAMVTQPIVSYYPYTEVHVIDWYLRTTHAPFLELKRRALLGIVSLLYDWSRFEWERLQEFKTEPVQGLRTDVVIKRCNEIREAVKACHELFRLVGLSWPSTIEQPSRRETLEEYVTEPTRLAALVHLTCFPRTLWHDEVAFQRTIHLGELCFFALRVSVMEFIENLRENLPTRAIHCLEEGTAIARLLQRAFVVLNTMPVEHFVNGIVNYTEYAGGIQSRGYQLLDVYLRGVDKRKEQVFERHPALSDLLLYKSDDFLSLKSLLGQARLRSLPDWPLLEKEAKELDEALMSWRGLHAAFARKYTADLPPTTRPEDGALGIAYLKLFLRTGLFDDTAVNTEQLKTLSVDPEWLDLVEYVPLHDGVAPPEHQRAVAPPPAPPPAPENA
jgi:tryptophan 2,3-dioxygenase